MKATESYRLINESPLRGIILYYSNVVLENIKPVKLKTVISEIQTGKTPPKANSKYYQSQDIDWFKPSDIGRSKYLEEAEEKFSEIALKEKKGTLYRKNTLLIIGIGGGVGRVSLLRNEGSSNQQITGLLFKDEIFPEWAYYYYLVREDYVKSQAKSMSFPILNQAKIKNLDFKYPSKKEQIEVCKFLDHCWECYLNNELPEVEAFQIPQELITYTTKQFGVIKLDEGIKGLIENQKELTTQLKQSILQEAIQGKLTEEWRKQNTDVEPASELLKHIKAEKAQLIKDKKIRKEKPLPPITEEEIPFELPEGWVWCRFGDIISITSGDGLTSKQMIPGEIPVFGGNGINGYHNAFNTNEETVTIGRVGAYCGAVHLTPKFAWITDNCFRVYYDQSSIHRDYLIWHLRYMNLGAASYDGSQPVISGKRVYPLLTFLPPFEEQKAIVEKLESLTAKSEALENEITQSEQHAQILMQAVLKEAFESKKEMVNVR